MTLPPILRRAIKSALCPLVPAIAGAERRLGSLRQRLSAAPDTLTDAVTLAVIRDRSLAFAASLRVVDGEGRLRGYGHSPSARTPVLYDTIAVLLLKHLYGRRDEWTEAELDLVVAAQGDDGLFRDPVIACPLAETEDWWGWRHLTLHALMALALYGRPARVPMPVASDEAAFRRRLEACDWGARAAWTSNELQNEGVFLQYARDHQGNAQAGRLMEILLDTIDAHQDPATGLYGHAFDTPEDHSNGVQAGYHFWLLHCLDGRPVPHAERVIDNVLATQNRLGGYGVQWNSSACEDIDSIDPLLRLMRHTEYRRDDIQASLARALPAVLRNLNPDGGWVFRRHEALTIGHPAMYSAKDEGNLFYTWFRTLGLAYCLTGLAQVPDGFDLPWTFARAPGHQFL